MWNIDTRWFDVAVFMCLYTAVIILFGHFEQHKPAWRRLFKAAICLGVLFGLAQLCTRASCLPLCGEQLQRRSRLWRRLHVLAKCSL
jgi:hypothetical protein